MEVGAKMFAIFLGLALLFLGLIPIISSFLMCVFDDRRTALKNFPGALLVFAIMGFIGYNTLAVEVGWSTIL